MDSANPQQQTTELQAQGMLQQIYVLSVGVKQTTDCPDAACYCKPNLSHVCAESCSGAAGDSADVFGQSSVSNFSFAALAAQSDNRSVSGFSTNGEISVIK